MNANICRAAAAACVIVCLAVAASEAAIRVEAYRGEPFGIGRVTVDLPQDDSASADDRFGISDTSDRVLYPVLEHRRQLGRIVRRFINIELPNRATYLLHVSRRRTARHHAPHSRGSAAHELSPSRTATTSKISFDDWWDAVCDRYERVQRDSEYPIVVDNYLTANWARRLGRDMPEPELALFGRERIGGSWVAQLTANEAYQALIERDLVLGRFGVAQTADVPLPPAPTSATARAGGEAGRRDRAARVPCAGRVLLRAVRQLQQLFVVPRFLPPLEERPRQHDLAAEHQSRDARPAAAAAGGRRIGDGPRDGAARDQATWRSSGSTIISATARRSASSSRRTTISC